MASHPLEVEHSWNIQGDEAVNLRISLQNIHGISTVYPQVMHRGRNTDAGRGARKND